MTSRWSVNITPAERVARVLVGLVGAVGGVWLASGAPSTVVAVLEVLLVVAGLDLVVTGALGHCPLYQKLGHVPRSLRRTA
ncbi:MAG TPA: YgaP-like transmembrane domain [Gemmatimonadales bacterium]